MPRGVATILSTIECLRAHASVVLVIRGPSATSLVLPQSNKGAAMRVSVGAIGEPSSPEKSGVHVALFPESLSNSWRGQSRDSPCELLFGSPPTEKGSSASIVLRILEGEMLI
jgi:hypothetical protein